MSYAAARAIGVYLGPEELSEDPIELTIGVAPDPAACQPAAEQPPQSGH